MKAIISVIVLLAALPGCGTPFFHFEEIRVVGLDFASVWTEASIAVSDREGRLDLARTDRGLRVMKTRWQTRSAAFGKGRRTRVHLEIVRLEQQRQLVRFYVEQQRNGNMSRRFDPSEEDWEDAGQDIDKQDILRHVLRTRFATLRDEGAPDLELNKTQDPFKDHR